MKIVAMSLLALLAAGAQAETQNYVYDPAKHAQVLKEHCEHVQKQLDIISKREKLGVKSWERSSIDKRRGELQGDYDKNCTQFKGQ